MKKIMLASFCLLNLSAFAAFDKKTLACRPNSEGTLARAIFYKPKNAPEPVGAVLISTNGEKLSLDVIKVEYPYGNGFPQYRLRSRDRTIAGLLFIPLSKRYYLILQLDKRNPRTNEMESFISTTCTIDPNIR